MCEQYLCLEAFHRVLISNDLFHISHKELKYFRNIYFMHLNYSETFLYNGLRLNNPFEDPLQFWV
jgi:hypothetical protein